MVISAVPEKGGCALCIAGQVLAEEGACMTQRVSEREAAEDSMWGQVHGPALSPAQVTSCVSSGAPLREPLQHVAYLHDGSLEGLLSAVFLAYERHEQPEDIVKESAYQPRLGQDSLVVETDCEHAQRVRRGVERAVGRASFTAILKASTCDDYDMGMIVYRFIRLAMARSPRDRSLPLLEQRAEPVVADLLRLTNRVVNECERMRQFVRFSHLENGVWYARCNPNASVVPLVMGHFAARLNDQPFIIYDEAHHLAGIYDGRGWSLVTGDAVNVPVATAHDIEMQEAWKRFYDTLSVDARYNPELRRHFLPVRLWRNLIEMQPRMNKTTR